MSESDSSSNSPWASSSYEWPGFSFSTTWPPTTCPPLPPPPPPPLIRFRRSADVAVEADPVEAVWEADEAREEEVEAAEEAEEDVEEVEVVDEAEEDRDRLFGNGDRLECAEEPALLSQLFS